MDKRVILWLAAIGLCASAPIHAGDDPKPVNLDKLNTAADEDDPFLADNLTLYFASNAAGTWDILVSRRSAPTQPFPPGKAVPGLASKDADERSPFLYAGKQLFFATNMVPDEKFKKLKNYDIKHRTGDRAPLMLPGISEPEDELHPWVAAGGKELYFSRKVKGEWTLFIAKGPVPGPIGEARSLEFPPGFHHATVSSTGLVMYLQGPLDKGRWGIFRSKRAKVGGAWSHPEAIANLNHADGPRGDMSPTLSPDNFRLYFVSDRPGGRGGLDIWSVQTSLLKTAPK